MNKTTELIVIDEVKLNNETIQEIISASNESTSFSIQEIGDDIKPEDKDFHVPPNFSNQNDFSFWFPKIKDCGIRSPKTQIFQVPNACGEDHELEPIDPDDVLRSFYMERKGDAERIESWVKRDIIPNLEGFQYFMKNSRFSNKFNFRHCITDTRNLANDLIAINYESLCFETNGEHEVILREVINWNESEVPCIYNGMPLRTEFRVFYDFDTQKVLYTANYWDYDYVRPHLRNKTDQIIFDAWRNKIEDSYNAHVSEVEALVEKHMKNVTGLTGQWSIDILLDEKTKRNIQTNNKEVIANYWLIDMAVAQASAYWNAKKDK